MTFVVFDGAARIASGSKLDAALAAQAAGGAVLIFDPEGRQVDFDLTGDAATWPRGSPSRSRKTPRRAVGAVPSWASSRAR